MMGLMLLNLLFGVLSLAWVWRSEPYDRLLGGGRRSDQLRPAGHGCCRR